MAGIGREAIRMSRSGREAIPEVLGEVRRPSLMFGISREAIPDVQEWS